jgi:endonuclease/exonuclease/phosphatase family metal-dependent hydrolase
MNCLVGDTARMLGNLFLSTLLLSATVTDAPAQPGADFTVMSFNIRNGRAKDGEDSWPLRKEQLFALLREEGADVIGLQEAYRDQADAIRRALPGYDEVGVGRNDGNLEGEHATILFRTDRFHLNAQGTFWFSDTPEVPGSRSWGNTVPRICTWARLAAKPGDRTFTVYNVHLDHESQPSRERSVALLLDRLRGTPGPRIVMGDFNAGESNPAVRALLDTRELALTDTFRTCHPAETAVLTFHGFQGGAEGEKIDYVFATEEFQATDARILRARQGGRYPSDHYPVTARLRWRETPKE